MFKKRLWLILSGLLYFYLTNCQEEKGLGVSLMSSVLDSLFEVFCFMSGGDAQKSVGSMTYGSQESSELWIEI